MIDLAVTARPAESIRILINGALVLEHCAGVSDTPDTLRAEVSRARHLQALDQVWGGILDRLSTVHNREDHTLSEWRSKLRKLSHPQTAAWVYVLGLAAGMRADTIPYPGDDRLPPLMPEQNPIYREGYEAGEAIRSIVQR